MFYELALGISVAILFIHVIYAVRSYKYLPAKVPSHFDCKGKVDKVSSKMVPTFLFPLLNVGVFGVLFFVRYFEGGNVLLDWSGYSYFILALTTFFFLFHIIMNRSAFGKKKSINIFVIPLVGGLFIVIGLVFRDTPQNDFFGIRTPWSLDSEEVWNEIHHNLGSKLFITVGIITVLSGLTFPTYSVIIMVVLLVCSSTFLFWWSYVLKKWESE